MNIAANMTVETRILDCKTGRKIGGNPPRKNLILDIGLNALARDLSVLPTYPAQCFQVCQVGSGNSANKISNPAITFTQSNNTVTASGGFFTATMVGGILKYGTGSGGTEQYITGFISTTQVTVSSSATVGAILGTVWMVQQTALQTFLYNADSLQTLPGDCGTTILGNKITFKRTFIFNPKPSQYSVNEIGWSRSTNPAYALGRIVLGSTDVVGTSNIYQVVLSLEFTLSPASPLAVDNVGTNINTAGNLMLENLSVAFKQINSSGQEVAQAGYLDGSAAQVTNLQCPVADYSQNSVPGNTVSIPGALNLGWANWAYNGVLGQMKLPFLTNSISTSGQNIYGICVGAGNNTSILDVKFTTPQPTPTGTFFPKTTWLATYTRQLTN